MPQFTLTLSDAALAKLKLLVDRYNQDQGATLSVQQWLALHLKEVAIAAELTAAVDALRRQAETDATAAFEAAANAERDRLLATL